MTARIDTVVLGATGYVGGELLRLVGEHPTFKLAAAVSSSKAGSPIADTFGHLRPALLNRTFSGPGEWMDRLSGQVAVFSAAPHGASATTIRDVLKAASDRQLKLHIVDASADFRFADQASYETIYGSHGAPELLKDFTSGLPEHVATPSTAHIGNPGCFATAMLLSIVPLLDTGLTGGRFIASGITGSTGSGRDPQPGTHHPVRHSNVYAYKPLAHRHAPEVENLAKAATGQNAKVLFVPHSGPFARGIHMTVVAEAPAPVNGDAIRDAFAARYTQEPFVHVVDGMPRLKDVVASNNAMLGVTTSGSTIAVTCVLDNLVKGAAGGAVQWMNRLFDLPQTAGLDKVAPAWT